MIIKNGEFFETTPDDFGPDILCDAAMEFARRKSAEKEPFFLYYAEHLTHDPYTSMRDPDNPKGETEPGMESNVRYMDHVIGELVESLKEMGVWDNTVMFVAGDNPSAILGKGAASEIGAHVPLIIAGGDKWVRWDENPMLLTACEWLDVFIDLQKQVRQGILKNGIWHLEVAQAGMYEFELRRWPREANRALSAGVPETQVTDGILEAGKTLPIRGARIRIGGQTQSRTVSDADKAAVFRIELSSGLAELETAFLTADEEELCGAYYVYVKRIE